MPVNSKKHLQHGVEMSDVKRGPEDPHGVLGIGTEKSLLSKRTLRTIEERNPYRFIEQALAQAKERLGKMKNTPAYIEGMDDPDMKKRYLKNENKALRD